MCQVVVPNLHILLLLLRFRFLYPVSRRDIIPRRDVSRGPGMCLLVNEWKTETEEVEESVLGTQKKIQAHHIISVVACT